MRGLGLYHRGHQVIFGPVILIARCVGEDFANRYLVAARQPRHVLAHGIIEMELALLLQQQDGGGVNCLEMEPME